jgi:hypothetical protein
VGGRGMNLLSAMRSRFSTEQSPPPPPVAATSDMSEPQPQDNADEQPAAPPPVPVPTTFGVWCHVLLCPAVTRRNQQQPATRCPPCHSGRGRPAAASCG